MSTSKSRRSVSFTKVSSSSSSAAAATTTPASGSSSFIVSTSSSSTGGATDSAGSIQSPLSPTRLSRQDEKKCLARLNDRLSVYIERVRELETENQRLSYQVKQSEETIVREQHGVKAVYEAELKDARRVLDETAREKAKLQIDSGKWKAQVDELSAKLGKCERDLKDNESRRLFSESQVQDLTGKLNNSDSQRKHWEDEFKKLRALNADLEKQLAHARKQLEDETLIRVDLENRIQSLREEIEFLRQLHGQEMAESRSRKDTLITEINDQLEGEYEAKLQQGIQEMRDQFDAQLALSRRDVENMYERKLQSYRDAADSANQLSSGSREELKRLRMSVDTMEKSRAKYEAEIAALEKKLRDLENDLNRERDSLHGRLAAKDSEIRRLQVEVQEMMREYQDLSDTKIQLDVELEAYRRLLEVEETRLHMSPGREIVGSSKKSASKSSYSESSASQRGTKRKRVLQEREAESFLTYKTHGEAKGDVEIVDHDTEGQFVKLHNKGVSDLSLAGWQLVREAEGKEVTFKFHRTLILKPGIMCTVWSSNSQVSHSPPCDLVMKQQQWPTGESIKTVLINSDDEEVATRESKRTSRSERVSFNRGTAAELGLDGTDDSRCSVM